MKPTNNLFFSDALLRKVASSIKKNQLITDDDSVLVAVSGGPDSVTLLHMLNLLGPLMFRKLGVAHLNHCIRPFEAERDFRFVSDLCKNLNLPFHTKSVDIHKYARKNSLNIEEAGRLCRYSFFKSLVKKQCYTKIALGHNADDNAELILMFLLRGSGPTGISGMPWIRNNLYIRPLLQTTRMEIMQYIENNSLQYISDSSNFDIKYTRNRIRHRLIPQLRREFNPNIVNALNTLSAVIRSEDDWMSETANSFLGDILVEKNPSIVILNAEKLRKLHVALARRILRKALLELKGNLRRIHLNHIESILALLGQKMGYRQLNLPDGIIVEVENEDLKLSVAQNQRNHSENTKPEKAFISFVYTVNEPQSAPLKICISELKSHFEFSTLDKNLSGLLSEAGHNTAFFDMDRLMFPLIIRNFRPGDRFAPLGMEGTQKLKNFFINAKVPKTKRKYIPILESGDHIIWIAGYRCSHYSRIRPQTKRALKVEFFLPKR